jgi:small multidrug resistance pump
LARDAWVSLAILAAAIAAEVCATLSLKLTQGFLTEGFTRPMPLILVVLGYGVAFWLLALMLRACRKYYDSTRWT